MSEILKEMKVGNLKMYVLLWVVMLISNTISAFFLMMASEATVAGFARIWIAINVGFLAAPILVFAWNFVWWINFLIVIAWIGRWFFHIATRRLWLESKEP